MSAQTETMKKKIKILLLLLLCTSLSRAMMDCDFEEDECGWFSGSEVGEGGFVGTTSEDQSNGGSDLYPTGAGMNLRREN